MTGDSHPLRFVDPAAELESCDEIDPHFDDRASRDHLTVETIRTTPSDEVLFELLGRELKRRLPDGPEPSGAFVAKIRALPIGLRSMASTYELSQSLSLYGLAWHFGNHHHKGLARETERGLRELGAVWMASIFSRAFELSEQYWPELGRRDWDDWYGISPIDDALAQLDQEAWTLQRQKGILDYWLSYARAHPDRCVDGA